MKKRRFKWDVQYLYWGMTAFCVIVAASVCFLLFTHWRTGVLYAGILLKILSPVLYGLIIAYLLTKPMLFIERTLFRWIKPRGARITERRAAALRRGLAVALTILLAITALAGALAVLLPRLYTGIEELLEKIPGYYNTAVDWVEKTLAGKPELETLVFNAIGNVRDWLSDWLDKDVLGQIDKIVINVTSGVIGVLREILNFLIGIVMAVYILYQREMFGEQIKKALCAIFGPKRAKGAVSGIRFLDRTCGSFIMSRLLDALIVGVVCYIILVIFAIPYAVLIAVLVGITNIVPFFGPFLGGVPSAFILLLESPIKCGIFIIIIVVIQQLDGNVLYPRIQGGSIGLSGFWILFAILLFGGLMGFWGYIVGVPIFAVIYSACRGALHRKLAITDKNHGEECGGASPPSHNPDEPGEL
ncbi:MAG: AI-2E family transporter [Oscillospiraceae bacterium]|jgi:predicted PurR-regulated permease PerM|nr:AI-2E family transporter [Oscillospiraceae bacterium]